MIHPTLTLKFLLVASHLYAATGLYCYKCNVPRPAEGEEQNLTCVTAPWDVTDPIETCKPHLKACLTKRIEHKGTGQIISFVRECSYAGKDNFEEKENYVFYHRYCFTSKCNTGNGLDSETGEQTKRTIAILVEDETSSGSQVSRQFFLSWILLFLVFLRYKATVT